MNKPSSAATFQHSDPSYEEDGYGWAMHQAALIRARQTEALDWDNVAEEIESMGRSEQRAVESALRLVLLHRLKWEYQPGRRTRSWNNSFRVHLRRFDKLMAVNPSLKASLSEILDEAYWYARMEAADETGMLFEAYPETPPSWDKIRSPLES